MGASRSLPLALAAIAASLSVPAIADTTAKITINGVQFIELSRHGGMSFQARGDTLAAGASADYDYFWTIELHDDGLPVSPFTGGGFLDDPGACFPIHNIVCGLSYTGYEQAKATLLFNTVDPRTIGLPLVNFLWTGDPPGGTFQTNSGPFADSVSVSGHSHLHVDNRCGTPLNMMTFGIVWGYVAPVPEPSSWALLAVGVAALGGCGWRNSRRAKPLG